MITKQQAVKAKHGEELYSMRMAFPRKLADGRVEPRRAWITGKCRTWQSHPEAFRLPIRIGKFTVSEIDQHSAKDWTFDKREAMRALNPLHPDDRQGALKLEV